LDGFARRSEHHFCEACLAVTYACDKHLPMKLDF